MENYGIDDKPATTQENLEGEELSFQGKTLPNFSGFRLRAAQRFGLEFFKVMQRMSPQLIPYPKGATAVQKEHVDRANQAKISEAEDIFSDLQLGQYDGVDDDIVIVMWLLHHDLPYIVARKRSPRSALVEMEKWADENKLELGSHEYAEASNLVLGILSGIFNALKKTSKGGDDGEDEAPGKPETKPKRKPKQKRAKKKK